MTTTRIPRTIAGLALAFALSLSGRAQAAAPDAGLFVHDYYAAYSAKDTARMAEFYTADATFQDPTFELDLKGPGAIKDLLTIALAKYESLNWEISHTLTAGDDVVVEGTMVGQLHGKVARVCFVSVFHFTGGKISAQRDMFDVMHFYTQLGVVPLQFRPKPATEPTPAKPAGG